MRQKLLYCILFTVFIANSVCSQIQKMPPSLKETADEPIRYTGQLNPDKRFYDGNLPYAVGAHHYQAFRANRKYPTEPGITGWGYNHQPYLAYWNNRFYLQYLSAYIQEHEPPTRTLIMTSKDGMNWSAPVVVFPEYSLPEINYENEIIPAGTKAVMHQRMGWYVAPNGKLLTLGFYGFAANPNRSPNAGNGLGRVVREVHEDGTFGPIYFIRFNRHAGWNETNTDYPFYKTSNDKGFLEACESLLANKLVSLQWWEEDRGKDGFFAIDPSQVPEGGYIFSSKKTSSAGAGKAFIFYHRPDDVIVGIWKNQYAALSPDNGKTWTPIVKNTTLLTTGAKTWGQRTEDGRYVIIHNQSATKRNRFPMTALVGDDGYEFNRIYVLRGEIPPNRYKGLFKNPGVQYFRGIVEGNGNPPGDHLWMTYSVNKEDIWITRTHVPITGSVNDEVNQDFESIGSVQDLELWNLYIPTWAPISIKKDPYTDNKYLELRDEEPYDYASATRIFPANSIKTIEFSFQGESIHQGYALEVEVQDQQGNRALKLTIDNKRLYFDIEKISIDAIPINPGKWNHIKLDIDCNADNYGVTFNGILYENKIPLNERSPTDKVERIVFRTGVYRNYVRGDNIEYGLAAQAYFVYNDLPGSELKAPLLIFNIDNLKTK